MTHLIRIGFHLLVGPHSYLSTGIVCNQDLTSVFVVNGKCDFEGPICDGIGVGSGHMV